MDVIDTIDAAVDGLCACPCRAKITGSSPSAYFASEVCAWRWHHGAADMQQLAAQAVAQFQALAVRAWEALCAIGQALRQLAQCFTEAAKALGRLSAAIAEPEPVPRTGPVSRRRPPRAIHPTRVRLC